MSRLNRDVGSKAAKERYLGGVVDFEPMNGASNLPIRLTLRPNR
jgi:hypothetical protein